MEETSKYRLERFDVCVDCLSPEITDLTCACIDSNYKTINLEFKVCACCDNLYEKFPADTEYNNEQLKKL
jgi:hypothetical protein